jgi:hypothetical protein
MAPANLVPDLSYPGGVTGTHKPVEQGPEDWIRTHFNNTGRLTALVVVRAGARHYSLSQPAGNRYRLRRLGGEGKRCGGGLPVPRSSQE